MVQTKIAAGLALAVAPWLFAGCASAAPAPSPAPLPSLGSATTTTAVAQAARILVVVDMQGDYCPDCVPRTPNPYHNDFLSEVPAMPTVRNISLLMQRMDFALTVFTKDRGSPSSKSFKPNSPGSDVIPELFSSARGTTLNFTKNEYDWLNERPGFYARNSEGAPLGQLLAARGLGPEQASMVVTGLDTNLCVFHGAVHAAQLGYDVTVFRDTTAGPPEEYKWMVGANGSRCTYPTGLVVPCAPALDNCTDVATCQRWLLSISDEAGGPSTEESFAYMEAAGIRVLPTFLAPEGTSEPTPTALVDSSEWARTRVDLSEAGETLVLI